MTVGELVGELQRIMAVHPEARYQTVQLGIKPPHEEAIFVSHRKVHNLSAVRLTHTIMILED